MLGNLLPLAAAFDLGSAPSPVPPEPQLGKAKGGRDFLDSLRAEGEAVEDVPHPAAAAAGAQLLPFSRGSSSSSDRMFWLALLHELSRIGA